MHNLQNPKLPAGFNLLHQAADATWDEAAPATFALNWQEGLVTGTVYDTARQRFVFLRSMETEQPLLQWLKNSDDLWELFPKWNFNRMHIFVPGQKIQLVPSALYDDGLREEFFGLNHSPEPQEKLRVNYLPRLGAYLQYALPADVNSQVRFLFPDADVYHQAYPWLECLLKSSPASQGMHLHIDVMADGVGVAAFLDGTLQLYNIFPAATDEDKLYFVMFVSEQLRINPHRDPFYLSGRIQREGSLHKLLGRYIKELRLEKRPELFHYSLPLLELPEHFYFKAFCSPVCES